MNKKKLLLPFGRMMVASFTLLLLCSVHSLAQADGLTLAKTSFRPGEKIQVHFTASQHYPANAWVGIIPSSIGHGSEAQNDKYDISYQYLNKRTKGTLLFRAPDKTGSYDFRMHDTDNNGRETSSVSFQVTRNGGEIVEQPQNQNLPSLKLLDRKIFKPGDTIRVQFSAPGNWPDNAWIGIIPSAVSHGSEAENDKHDISYQYLKGRTRGVLTFTAPRNPGSYDFRMHDTDSNGREFEHVTFKVVP